MTKRFLWHLDPRPLLASLSVLVAAAGFVGCSPGPQYDAQGFISDEPIGSGGPKQQPDRNSQPEALDGCDRCQPARIGKLTIGHGVSRTVLAGDKLVRLGYDPPTRTNQLDVVPASTPEVPQPLGSLDLALLAPEDPSVYDTRESGPAELFANGDLIYVAWAHYHYTSDDPATGLGGHYQHVAIVDVADSSSPTLLGHAALPMFDTWDLRSDPQQGPLVYSGAGVVAVGTSLVVQTSKIESGVHELAATLRVIDLSDPTAPRLAGSLEWPGGRYFTGLITHDGAVYASHAERVVGAPGKVRFFVDRIDVSNPDAPLRLGRINTPGSLLAIQGENFVTVDYAVRVSTPGPNGECPWADFGSYDGHNCSRVERTFRALDVRGDRATHLSAIDFPTWGRVDRVFVGDDRIFAEMTERVDNYDPLAYTPPAHGILVLGDIRGGYPRSTLLPWLNAPSTPSRFEGRAVGGQRLVLADYSEEAQVAVFDATNLDAPTFSQATRLRGRPLSIKIVGDEALCSLGLQGLQRLSLAP